MKTGRKKCIFSWLKTLLLVGLLSMASVSTYCQVSFYVATSGSDNNPGTIASPCRTLEAARALADSTPAGTSVYIYLRGGEYFLSNTFSLSTIFWDATKSLHISSYNNEPVTLSGGQRLDNSQMSLVKDPAILRRLSASAASQVYVTALSAQQITDPGQLNQFGYGHAQVAPADELFFGDQVMQLARAPNSGKLTIGQVSSSGTVGDGATKSGAIFQFSYGPAANWAANNKDIWVSGYFDVGWMDETAPVTSLSGNTVKLGGATTYGVQSSIASPTNSARDQLAIRGFYFFNILDALDTAGEYYIDRTNSLLYFWPPSAIGSMEITLSVLTAPMISITGLSNITIQGIKFAHTRGCAIQAKNASHITISHDTFCDLGQIALSTDNCTYWVVDQSKFYNIGSTAVSLTGGNRTTLATSGNVVKNSEFYYNGRLFRSFSPSISLQGVGAVVSNCYIHDLAGQAILYQGNNHMIVNNQIINVCGQFSDVGAVATGRDPSSTGTLITNNFFQNITCSSDLLVNAIYIDDGSGGIKVHSNLFLNCGTGGNETSDYGMGAIHINGGADNELLNNIFINERMAVSGLKWDVKTWSTYLTSAYIKQVTLQDVNILSSVYQQQYPWLKDFFNASRTRSNTIANSVATNVRYFMGTSFNAFSTMDSSANTTLQNTSTWTAIENFFKTTGISPNARAWLSWTPINFDAIGIKPD